jgi:hypothetical protein
VLCLKCGSEYREGFTRCADCDVDLVAALPREPHPEPVTLITVARFRETPAAELARTTLEAAGLPCVLADDHVIAIMWHLSNALGGVALRVADVDEDAAVKLLKADCSVDVLTLEGAFPHATTDDLCSKCGDAAVVRVNSARKAGAAMLLARDVAGFVMLMEYLATARAVGFSWLLLPFTLLLMSWQIGNECQRCGHFWKPPPLVPPAELTEGPGLLSIRFTLREAFWLIWPAMVLVAMWMLWSFSKSQ